MEENWNCHTCTFSNNSIMNQCEMCNSSKKDNNTFVIYTSGIANWVDVDTIIKNWIGYNILNNILTLIPDTYTNIKLRHYEPLYYGVENAKKIHPSQVKKIKDLLQNNDLKYDRVTQSLFFPESLPDIKMTKDYLIIDFAHIFQYTNQIGIVKLAGHYNENDLFEKKLKTVYIGFIGNPIDENLNGDIVSHGIILNNFFKVLDNGQVETYIDKMIQMNYDFDPKYPQDKINHIINNVKKNLMNKWREIYDKVDDTFDKQFNNTFVLLLTKSIMNYIMKNYRQEILVSLVNQKAFDSFPFATNNKVTI
jgi:hypothetical protein